MGIGFSDPNEVLAGTGISDPSSYLGFVESPASDGSGDVITWQSASNRTYVLSRSTNLAEGFTDLVISNIAATPPVNSYTTTPPAAESWFYGLRLQLP